MRIKKILSLAVVLAMVMAVVPTFGLTASAKNSKTTTVVKEAFYNAAKTDQTYFLLLPLLLSAHDNCLIFQQRFDLSAIILGQSQLFSEKELFVFPAHMIWNSNSS